MPIGRFYAGIAALIYLAETGKYLLLRRSAQKDFAPGVWECVTGRVDQGEGFEDALRREVREELGVEVRVEYLLGTTHFYRGAPGPENELVGVIYLCTIPEPASIHISDEHSEFRWSSAAEAVDLLSAGDGSSQWARRVIERAERLQPWLSKDLLSYQSQAGFELG